MSSTWTSTVPFADLWAMKAKEKWCDIEGFEGFYQASSLGNIRSVDRYVERSDGRLVFCKGRVLSTFQGTTCNYLSVQLSKHNTPSKHLVHRLIAKTFLGLRPDSDLEVNHIDGNRHNNRVDNLEIVSHQQNIDHSVATGLKNDYGEKHAHAKLTNQQAADIRDMWKRGVKQKDMAEMYGVHKQVICNIVNYKTYIR